MGWGGRQERGSGWGTHVNPWLIHVSVWQKPLQYCKVISLQLIKINEKKKLMLKVIFNRKCPTGESFQRWYLYLLTWLSWCSDGIYVLKCIKIYTLYKYSLLYFSYTSMKLLNFDKRISVQELFRKFWKMKKNEEELAFNIRC